MWRIGALFIATASALQRPALHLSPRRVSVSASVEEVSLAASQQLVALAAVAVAEGAWSTVYGGASVQKAIKFLGPTMAAGAALVVANGSVSSASAAAMAPGLGVSCLASLGLLASYVLRLTEADKEAPPKEIVAFFAAVAFFGFSTAFQSLFAAGIIEIPFFQRADVVPGGFPELS